MFSLGSERKKNPQKNPQKNSPDVFAKSTENSPDVFTKSTENSSEIHAKFTRRFVQISRRRHVKRWRVGGWKWGGGDVEGLVVGGGGGVGECEVEELAEAAGGWRWVVRGER